MFGVVPTPAPTNGPGCHDVEVSIVASAEQSYGDGGWGEDGTMYLGSSDLEAFSDGGEQIFGVQFRTLRVPAGSVISAAAIDFTIASTPAGAVEAVISLEQAVSPASLVDDSVTSGGYTDADHRFNLSDRMAGSPSVPWTMAGAAPSLPAHAGRGTTKYQTCLADRGAVH